MNDLAAKLQAHAARRADGGARLGGVIQPAPAPRFSRTPGAVQSPPAAAGDHTEEILRELGYDEGRIARLRDGGSVASGRRPSAA